MNENNPTIYQVTTQGDVEGKGPSRILGYAIGDPFDIKEFYSDKKLYDISITKIIPVIVTPEAVKKRKEDLKEKASLEQRLEEIKNGLN